MWRAEGWALLPLESILELPGSVSLPWNKPWTAVCSYGDMVSLVLQGTCLFGVAESWPSPYLGSRTSTVVQLADQSRLCLGETF